MILFIIGSLRAKSFNRQLANQAREVIGARADVKELDYSDLPLINQDIELPEPAAVARVRRAIQEADVLPSQLGIALPADAWTSDVLTLGEDQKAQLKALADNVLS